MSLPNQHPTPRIAHPTASAIALLVAILVCAVPGLPPTAIPTLTPVPTPSPTPEVADTGWGSPEPGLELRQVWVNTGQGSERLLLVRLDPSRFHFHILYTPGTGRTISEWALEAISESPLLIVNGGYFTPEYRATGLLVAEGQTYGVPYGDFAGMLVILPGGRVAVRWLAAQPYDPDEMILGAIQSFPMLVRPGGVLGFPADADDGWPARRTVVAQDREGWILFIVAPRGYFTLYELARWLVESDLNLDTALNLDGGQSTGLYLYGEERRFQIDSLVPIPSVIAVERR